MADQTDFSGVVGRERTAFDTVTAGPLQRFCAVLDREVPHFSPGDAVPPLAHWLFFLDAARQSELGPDGHAARGDFLPAAPHLPRRMWAGSRISFPGVLRVGMTLRRHSRIAAAHYKVGASGPLLFVTVRHEIAEEGGPILLVDEHDIVYRAAASAPARHDDAGEQAPSGPWRREMAADETLLFRYSALTFNGHRIHYDRDYAVSEGYAGLIVHGPLLATLLVDLIWRNRPQAVLTSYAFRAHRPILCNEPFFLNGLPGKPESGIELWTADRAGRKAMTAQAVLA
ncbi:MAG: MaoC family dehydratase N-terminal domain-containing protein [Nitratireductor sp.]|nr:MaoC family dehydratase N-terminal domain-containing protein [Nitratireductor sp.]